MNDAEIIITEVEKRPLLWDISDGHFKDKNKKYAAWLEVGSCLLEENMPTSEAEEKIIVQDVTAKWRSIRDNYVRSRKKHIEAVTPGVTSTKRVKRYCYEKHLRFLEKNMELRTKKRSKHNGSNTDYSVDEHSYSGSDDGTDTNNQLTDYTKPIDIKITPIKLKFEDKVPNIEAHQSKVEDLFLDDADLAFFYSLLPAVRSLNFDQKFTFRIQTMQLLQSIKSCPE